MYVYMCVCINVHIYLSLSKSPHLTALPRAPSCIQAMDVRMYLSGLNSNEGYQWVFPLVFENSKVNLKLQFRGQYPDGPDGEGERHRVLHRGPSWT